MKNCLNCQKKFKSYIYEKLFCSKNCENNFREESKKSEVKCELCENYYNCVNTPNNLIDDEDFSNHKYWLFNGYCCPEFKKK